ncbi:MAG: membrane protein insertion efficiency factor YidD [Synergistaceae bacterium]|nr:membrane protein insertion efficiency factor YidD [Synergistaceae bacterium]
MVFCIRFYQAAISPLLGGGKCRFYPTCSEYAANALARYGPCVGMWLAASRILKCGPWHEGGFDPVPEPDEIALRKWLGKLLKKRSYLRKVR